MKLLPSEIIFVGHEDEENKGALAVGMRVLDYSKFPDLKAILTAFPQVLHDGKLKSE